MIPSESRAAAIAAVRDDEVVDALRQLLHIEGGVGQERQMVDWLAAHLPNARWQDVQLVNGQNVVARIPGRGGPALLVTAYVDSPPAGVMQRAYDAAIEDGAPYGKQGQVMRGRGCCTKATLAAMIGAGTALARAGIELDGDLILAGTSHDDSGARAVLAETKNVALAVVGEPTGNQVGIAARGIAWMDLIIRGKAVHSGMAEQGVNPIDKLPAVLDAIRLIPLPKQDGLPPALLSAVHIDTMATAPRTPHWITVRLDRRLLSGETAAQVKAEIDEVLAALRKSDPTLDTELKIADEMLPFRARRDGPFVRSFSEAVRTVTGSAPALSVVPHGTSAGLLQERGIESAMFGPAYIEDRNDDEHVLISKLTDAARILAGLAASTLA